MSEPEYCYETVTDT